jgi:hypothetical protein
MRQGSRYADELQKATGVLASTKFCVFVLGSRIANAQDMKVGDAIVAQPLCYEAVLRRAHARTFNLQRKLSAMRLPKNPDREVDEVVASPQQEMFT